MRIKENRAILITSGGKKPIRINSYVLGFALKQLSVPAALQSSVLYDQHCQMLPEVQQNQNSGSATVYVYVDVIETFVEGSLIAVVRMETRLKIIKAVIVRNLIV